MTTKDELKSQPGSKEDPTPELEILNIRGELYHTRLTKKFRNKRKWTKPDERQLMSFIPGTVCEVFVRPGDLVEVGSRLMILEAMKMQNVIISPVAGRIKSIMVKKGEKIRKGVLIVEFE
ncbi:MAG: acetyl-CoA carboxylase biotin carboxyl carrier protein subunit [Bacteroidales bacterium]|nr:acetyl-CoA carboxylase biotin carboxyl carrier protein subunit [Bacteroidales bacterium]MBN2762763.1 acetyl-CoA carboxylase biotin carboxyl carrier protein subunit [Bacteroidales bacterium]